MKLVILYYQSKDKNSIELIKKMEPIKVHFECVDDYSEKTILFYPWLQFTPVIAYKIKGNNFFTIYKNTIDMMEEHINFIKNSNIHPIGETM